MRDELLGLAAGHLECVDQHQWLSHRLRSAFVVSGYPIQVTTARSPRLRPDGASPGRDRGEPAAAPLMCYPRKLAIRVMLSLSTGSIAWA